MSKSTLIIATSTFPRWPDDNVPRFVYDFAQHNKPNFKKIIVLAPGDSEAKSREVMEGVEVIRFRYWFTGRGQNLTYGSGAIDKVKLTPLYLIKVLCYSVAMLYRLCVLARSNQNSVINAHWLVPQGYIAAIVGKYTNARVVVTIHGGDVFSFNHWPLQYFKRYALKNADRVVVNSSATKLKASKIYARDDYEIIPMGVNLDKFKNTDKADTPKFKILFVGRLTEGKGVIYLVKAIKQLIEDSYKNIELHIVGAGIQSENIRDYITKNSLEDKVFIHGWIDQAELPKFYQDASVFVGPSIVTDDGWQEAFGLVFVEALSTKTPVITTDTGGTAEIVINNKTGLVVKQKSVNELTNALKILHNEPETRERLAKAGYEHVHSNFSWQKIIKKYEKILLG